MQRQEGERKIVHKILVEKYVWVRGVNTILTQRTPEESARLGARRVKERLLLFPQLCVRVWARRARMALLKRLFFPLIPLALCQAVAAPSRIAIVDM